MAERKKDRFKNKVEIVNRKAKFDYEFVETEVAGIVLTGTEIKSIREGRASLVDTYCYINPKMEVYVKNMHIAKYEDGTYLNHEERRDRKLLLTRKQIRKFIAETTNPPVTIVPVKMFINDKGYCKVLIALARGKREYDKRETIKENDSRREMERARKNF